jgi:L-lactate dehydrogenase complex protein LldG
MVEGPLMSERENIIGRIREALAVAAPVPGSHGSESKALIAGPQTSLLPNAADHRRVMPAAGLTPEQQLELLTKNAADLRADFRLVKNLQELADELKRLAAKEGWQSVASHRGELTSTAAQAVGLPVLFTDDSFDKRELARCDVGLTECDALVAQTGTVVVTNRSAGGRALSVLPPHHVVLAQRRQILPDLPAAFALLREKYGVNYPSMISLITGPSRTGDIERILVLGAHGPKKLTIFCCAG